MSDAATLHDSLNQEQLQAIGDEIATFAARIDVAEHALITRLRVFDAHEAWGGTGFLSCAHWLSWRIGIGLKAAREKVRVARALGTLTAVDALFSRGELSYSKVRAITRVATPENEQEFIDAAVHATASQIELLTRAYKRCRVQAEIPGELPRDQRRFVRRAETLGGMVRIEMQLTPEEAAVVWEAMQSAMSTGEAEASAEVSVAPSPTLQAPSAQASAEASTEPTHAQASAGMPADPLAATYGEELQQQQADAIVNIARAYLQHSPRTLSSGYELVVITSEDQLEHGPGGVGGFLRDGTPVPLHVARMLACDSARVDVVTGADGELLDVGRSTRSIPSAITRALWLRDGGCRVPGCGRKRHLHGHHIQAWAEGGPTRLANLVLVCPGHHRMIHEGGLSVEVRADKIMFIDQRGHTILAAPPRVGSDQELEALERFLREADLHIDASTTTPKWDGRPMNLSDTLDWMFIADRSRAVGTGVGTTN
ncbi:HNH endonuclease signature motif containing protein [Enhygromyxa salina]|uniref:HNH endonuclease signature motif containing protein n=1 Tax=Enhygromyxa salina TaxID=215803 RepID=UPI00069720C9|nr:HNH endonuclease signature motif containing protein [Enhygromyxa salina]